MAKRIDFSAPVPMSNFDAARYLPTAPYGYLVACEFINQHARKCGMPGRVASPTAPFRCDTHKEGN